MYVCPHSTNMESSKIDEALKGAKAANIKNILALRGGRFAGTLLAPPLGPQDRTTSDRQPQSLTRCELS